MAIKSREVWKDKATLEYLYLERGRSQKEIATRVGCGQSTVARWLDRFEIATRDNSGYVGERPWKDARKIKKLYHSEGLSLNELAEKWDCDPVTIWKAMNRHGIQTRRCGMPEGKEHPHYKHGKTPNYGPNWYEMKRKARKRDEYVCQACGKHQSEQFRKLSVHHITPRSEFVDENGVLDYEQANRLENLVCLCDSCHNKWEGIPLKPKVIEA